MGLLDQVLGQVIGNMAGGGQGRAGPAPGGGLSDILGQVLRGGQGGATSPGPTPAPRQGPGGGLGDLLGGAGGKLSPLLLAVLAVLASKHLPSGAGGVGSILRDMLGGGQGRGPDPREDGPHEGYAGDEGYGEPPPGMDASPYPEPHGGGRGRGASGGFLEEVGSILDGPGGRATPRGGGDPMGEDFDDLRHRFERNGQGDLMDSWIGSGPNREAAPGDLEQALGPQTIDRLSQQFGIDRGQLLQELSQALPQVVDGLTPQGRVPSAEERSRWI